MTQSGLLRRGMVVESPKRLKITVPRFDNTAIIEGYAKSLIGRCLNPGKQDMKTLLFMLPKIWRMEERVEGTDLGGGRFLFAFQSEEDIREVLLMEPFHFDYWMLSLVRWEPSMEANYPSKIRFWVKIVDLPLQWWDVQTFMMIGQGLGEMDQEGIDLRRGRIRVWVDGFKPLIFEVDLTVFTGAETIVSLGYEKLFGFCRRCNRLCHDSDICPLNKSQGNKGVGMNEESRGQGYQGPRSYKGAVELGNREGHQNSRKYMNLPGGHGSNGAGNKVRKGYSTWIEKPVPSIEAKSVGLKSKEAGEGLSEVMVAVPFAANRLKMPEDREIPDPTKIMLEAFQGKQLEGEDKLEEVEKDVDCEAVKCIEFTSKDQEVAGGEQEQEENVAEGEIKVEGDEMNEAELEESIREHAEMGEEDDDDDLLLETEQMVAGAEQNISGIGVKVEGKSKEKEQEVNKMGAKRRLFQQPMLGIGGTTKQRIVRGLLSPKKGNGGRVKVKDARGAEEKGSREVSKLRLG